MEGGNYLLYTKIKMLCGEKGISVRTLEIKLEFSSGSICKWNENIPSFDKVEKAAEYLGVSLDKLRDYSGNQHTNDK